MNKRKALIEAIHSKLSDDMMPLTIGGHTITDQYVYAGCQWMRSGREWDETRHALAWIVDGQYQLTFPKLDWFDGDHQIEKQTKYYLQPDCGETPPHELIGEPVECVPDKVLLDIAKGLADALEAHAKAQARDDTAAAALIEKLGRVGLGG